MPKHDIILKPDATADLDDLNAYDATCILDAIEDHLTFEPQKESRSRIKRLRGIQPADYRLRVDHYRVFCTVEESRVTVLRVLHKDACQRFYREEPS